MEGFLEANRVVEVSFNKLASIHKGGDLPLRRTLLISKVLNRAQDAATSAHLTLMSYPSSTTPRGSSKLLASISKKVEDASIYEPDCLPAGALNRPARPTSRQQSPIASTAVARPEDDEEAMDFASVNSVLDNILSFDNDNTAAPCSSETEGPPSPKMAPLRAPSLSNRNEIVGSTPTTKRSRLLEDVSNSSKAWSSWQENLNEDNQWPCMQFTTNTWSPPSPVKRAYCDAFPFEKENLTLFDLSFEDPKRFKPSPPEGCPLESLPGFCGYFTPKNLSSGTELTYTFGSAFGQVSSWPSCFGTHDSEQRLIFKDQSFSGNHFPTSTPILAF